LEAASATENKKADTSCPKPREGFGGERRGSDGNARKILKTAVKDPI